MFLLGRILFGGFFIVGGINHFQHLGMMAGFSASKGVPGCQGRRHLLRPADRLRRPLHRRRLAYRKSALACIILFLLPVTFLMHAYWTETDPMQRMSQRVHFQKNVALLGAALMLLMIQRPWPLSIDLP